MSEEQDINQPNVNKLVKRIVRISPQDGDMLLLQVDSPDREHFALFAQSLKRSMKAARDKTGKDWLFTIVPKGLEVKHFSREMAKKMLEEVVRKKQPEVSDENNDDAK